jgi:hypothetical protein
MIEYAPEMDPDEEFYSPEEVEERQFRQERVGVWPDPGPTHAVSRVRGTFNEGREGVAMDCTCGQTWSGGPDDQDTLIQQREEHLHGVARVEAGEARALPILDLEVAVSNPWEMSSGVTQFPLKPEDIGPGWDFVGGWSS